MNRFMALFKKEIRELLTLQMILPLLIGIMIFVFIGNVVGKESRKASSSQSIIVHDLDSSPTSQMVADILESAGYQVFLYSEETVDLVIEEAKEKNIYNVISIPSGFEKGLLEFKPQRIENYNILQGFSVSGLMSSGSGTRAFKIINEHFSNMLIMKKALSENPEELKNPITAENLVVLGSKTANVSLEELMGFINSQTMFIPIVIFVIIIMASQTVVVAIASEKENKTLETLLSTPISRTSLVTAKMSAAGIVSLIMAAVYMVGMSYYIRGVTGDAFKSESSQKLISALNQLGLTLGITDYLLIGVSLFLSILIALAVSLILGVFSEDVKKAQSLIAPIIFIVMIPYFISMFMNLDTASPALKYFVYAIPFSHSFLVSQGIFFRRYMTVTWGIIYQLIVLILLIIIAAKIFTTDRVLTAKIKFNRKK
ncbi:MAG: ABC transporter permease [Firmicutes bacterium]|nr:ABC transporter permease [Bacillota bacterium]